MLSIWLLLVEVVAAEQTLALVQVEAVAEPVDFARPQDFP